MKQLKTISVWGTKNPIKARIIIVTSHIMLLFSGIYLGITSYVNDVRLPYEVIPILVSVFFLAYIFYPKRGHKTGWWKHNYTRQKTMDGLLVVSSFLILTIGVNRFAYEPIPAATVQFIVHTTPNQLGEKSNIRKTFKSVKKKLKNDLKELKRMAKQKRQRKSSAGILLLQFLLILLTLALAAIAAYAVFILSCHLSCSGQEGLAIVVLIGGFVGIVWLSILGFIRIFQMSGYKTAS